MSEAQIPLFKSGTQTGYSHAVRSDSRRILGRKRVRELEVEFAQTGCAVETPEGTVRASRGDAIMTGTMGERWCVPADRFPHKYRPVPPTVAGQSGRYLSLPIEVMAVPMDVAFEVLLLDGISRLRGHSGDWLVDYGDGSLGVVARRIFAATYEIIG